MIKRNSFFARIIIIFIILFAGFFSFLIQNRQSPLAFLSTELQTLYNNIESFFFIASAQTPATFGYTTIASTPDSDTGYMNAWKFTTTASQSGTVTSASVYVISPVSASPNDQFQIAVYSNQSNNPRNLIASSPSGTLTANSWNTVPINMTLSANTTYWIAYNSNAIVANENGLVYNSGFGKGAWRQQAFGTWPALFGATGSAITTGSIYLTYTPPGTPTPPPPTPTPTPTPTPSTTVITFDNPVPSGSAGSLLNGVFQGIDFGSNKWRWEGATGPDPDNNIYFNSAIGTSRTFTFSPAPRALTSMRVFSADTSGTITLTDNLGQTKAYSMSIGSMQTITTAWTQASTQVTVNFPGGWSFGIDDITHGPPSGSPTPTPTPSSGSTPTPVPTPSSESTPIPGSSSTPTPVPTPIPDTIPPTISLTSPTNNAIVSGTAISVSANASDNIGIGGVQFLLDGKDLDMEDTESPYSIAWDSTKAFAGSHTLSARARDLAGNNTASSLVNVTVAVSNNTISTVASTDTNWIKGGINGKNIVFTVQNVASSSAAIQWVRITRPSANYTLSTGSAVGWSAAVSASSVTFTGGSIAPGLIDTFTIAANTTATDEDQIPWTISADDQSAGTSPITAAPMPSKSIQSGIDSTPPTGSSITSVTINSNSQLTAVAASPIDTASGLNPALYWFDETTGNTGGTDSMDWQSSPIVIDSGLAPTTRYCYRVKTRDNVGNESAFSASSCKSTPTNSDTTPPAQITNLTAGSPTGNSLKLSWTAPGNDDSVGTATSYEIRYSTAPISPATWETAKKATGVSAPKPAGSSESFVVSGLNGATTYYFAIKAFDDTPNASPLSNATTAITAKDIDPPSISNLLATGTGETKAAITWSTDEPADSRIEYGIDTDYDLEASLNTGFITSHSINLTGLLSGTLYHYRVKARDYSGNLAVSPDASFWTALSVFPIDGQILTLSDISASPLRESAAIMWKTNRETTSQVEYGPTIDFGSKTEKNNTLTRNHQVTIPNLTPQTGYVLRVISEDGKGSMVTSGSFNLTTQALPLAASPSPPPPIATAVISDISVVAALPTSAKIIWTTDIPATSQIIFGLNPNELNQATLESSTLVTDHEVVLSDLKPHTAYYFAVISRHAIAVKVQGKTGTFTTQSLEIQTVIEVKKLEALAPGSPGTQVPKIIAGETATLVPITATQGDTTPPQVALLPFTENPTADASPTIKGRASDALGVIAGVSYSTDGSISWHPVTTITGIGSTAAQFSAKIPNLQEGNYPILFRVRDNSGNIGKSETKTLVMDIVPPGTGANVILLGTQSLIPQSMGALATLSGITQRILISSVGGAISVDVIARKKGISDNTVPGGASSSDITMPLIYSRPNDLWFGDMQFANAGIYDLYVRAIDGAKRSSLRPLNQIQVANPGIIRDATTHQALGAATVAVFRFSGELNSFLLWPGEIFNQANPQITGIDGSYRFILPPGKYYVKVTKKGYRTFYTQITEFSGHATFNEPFDLTPLPSIPLPIQLFGMRQIFIPTFGSFFAKPIVQESTSASFAIETIAGLIGKPAPLFSLSDQTGTPVDLRYLRGKKTILSTWSTWSPLAQIQIPILNELQKKEKDNVKILLLSLHESRGIIETYLRRGEYELSSIIDRDGILTQYYPILTLPQHFFLDRKGVIRDAHVGFLSELELREKLNTIP